LLSATGHILRQHAAGRRRPAVRFATMKLLIGITIAATFGSTAR